MNALAWLLVGVAPLAGWLLWSRLPAGPGEADDPLETAFASVLCAVFATGCLALLLAGIGVLGPAPLIACLVVGGGVLWSLPRRSPASSWTTPPAGMLVNAAAVTFVTALAAISLAPASEDLLGGRDPGTYANTASWIASHGSLRVQSDLLTTVPRGSRHIFSSSIVFPGFYVGDAASGEVVPQFLHLHPTLMALGDWLGGLEGAFLVPPFVGVLAELAVFFFVRRMLGLGAAIVASVVLILNLAQIWGMRNPYSEGLTQLGVFAALWCTTSADRTGGVRWGVLGGVALGICFLARVDALLLLPAIVPPLVFINAAAGPRRWITHAFLPVALLFAVWSVAHALIFSRPYVTDLAHLIWPLWALTAAVMALSALALFWRAPLRAAAALIDTHGWRLWAGAALALAAAFALAVWVRPHLEPFALHPTRGIRTYVEEALPRVGWYFSTAGLIVALAGVILALHQWLVDRRLAWLPFLSPFLAFSLLYFWNARIAPDHPWMMRRFLPVVVPGMAVAIGAAAAFAWSARGRWRLAGRLLAVAGVGMVLVHQAAMAAPFWTFREKQGLIRQLAGIARQVPANAVVLYSHPGIDHYVATPLALAWQRDVLPVMRDRRIDPDGELRRGRFEAQVMRWLHDRRDVFYLTANDADSVVLSRELRWEEVAKFRLNIATMGSHLTGPPRAPLQHAEQYRLLRAVPAVNDPAPCAGSSLHVDGGLGGITQGLFRMESAERDRFYWASPNARVMFPWCDRTGSGRPQTVRVYAACGRSPANAADCRVEVAVNDEPAGILELAREFADHDVPMPASAVAAPAGAIEIQFRGPAYLPSERGAADARTLSFQVTSVTLR